MKHARYINEEFQVNVNVTLGYRTSEGAQRTKRYEKRHPWKPSLFIKSDASMSLICCALAHQRNFRRKFLHPYASIKRDQLRNFRILVKQVFCCNITRC